jgi:hypothetical protein
MKRAEYLVDALCVLTEPGGIRNHGD